MTKKTWIQRVEENNPDWHKAIKLMDSLSVNNRITRDSFIAAMESNINRSVKIRLLDCWSMYVDGDNGYGNWARVNFPDSIVKKES
jgi:hypothetical protein